MEKLPISYVIIGGIVLIIAVFAVLIFAASPEVTSASDAGSLRSSLGIATGPSVALLAADKCRMMCDRGHLEDVRWYYNPSFPEGTGYENCQELLDALDGGDNSFVSRCGRCANRPGGRASCSAHQSKEWCEGDISCQWEK
ncbi:MAG: hypothetical protein ABIB71_07185 [Candidatus Woesearchaeota archaeon]